MRNIFKIKILHIIFAAFLVFLNEAFDKSFERPLVVHKVVVSKNQIHLAVPFHPHHGIHDF